MGHTFVQLLLTQDQQKILIQALRFYSDKVEAEGNTEEAFRADEMRLNVLKMRRQQQGG